MAYDSSFIVKDVTTVLVLFFVFLLFYTKFKKVTMGEAIKEMKESVSNLFGGDDVPPTPFKKNGYWRN